MEEEIETTEEMEEAIADDIAENEEVINEIEEEVE
jgi:hypothetical protein